MTEARDIEEAVAFLDTQTRCGGWLPAEDIILLIADWRAKDKQIDLFSQAILDHYREKHAAVEAMRAKCEAIAREYEEADLGYDATAVKISDAISALKP